MAGRRNPKRWIIRRLGDAGALTGYELATMFRITDARGPVFKNAFYDLQRSGHIERGEDHLYSLTGLGQEALMRIRKAASETPTVVNMQAEKERLILDFAGPHGLAIEAVEDDAILSERLAIAIADEMPPCDLISVPRHRRPQVIEDAVDFWTQSTKEGPCGMCGTRTARSAPFSGSYMDSTSPPSFAVKASGIRVCSWCDHYMASHTEAEFREAVFNAVVGTWGVIILGEYRAQKPWTPFAHEIGYVGTAWGHLKIGSKYEEAMRARALLVVHRKRFVVNEGQQRTVAMSGIETPIWEYATLPHERKVFAPLADIKAYRDELERGKKGFSRPGIPGHLRRMAQLDIDVEHDAKAREAEAQELRDWAKKNRVI